MKPRRIPVPWQKPGAGKGDTWRSPGVIVGITGIVIGLLGTAYGVLQSERIARLSGQFDHAEARVILSGFDLRQSQGESVSMIWGAPDHKNCLTLPRLRMTVLNSGQRTLNEAYLVLRVPSLATAVVDDTLLSIEATGPHISDLPTRNVSYGPAFTHVTYSIGQVNPGQAVDIWESLALDRTEHTMELDSLGHQIEIQYALQLSLQLTARDHPVVDHQVEMSMLATRDSFDLEFAFMKQHYRVMEEERAKMNFVSSVASRLWGDDDPYAIFIRPK